MATTAPPPGKGIREMTTRHRQYDTEQDVPRTLSQLT
jgi:hypothetical protein